MDLKPKLKPLNGKDNGTPVIVSYTLSNTASRSVKAPTRVGGNMRTNRVGFIFSTKID